MSGDLASNDQALAQLAGGGTSLRDRLRAQAQADIQPQPFEVPGYDGLVAMYRPLTDRERDEVNNANFEQGEQAANVRLLLLACVGMYARDHDGTLEPILGEGGEHARYDAALAWYLGLELQGTLDDLLRRVFKHNAMAIGRHSGEVSSWMINPRSNGTQQTLGG
jgi:hypothetical protein